MRDANRQAADNWHLCCLDGRLRMTQFSFKRTYSVVVLTGRFGRGPAGHAILTNAHCSA